MKKIAYNFSQNQMLFIGIDVHLRSWHVCIRSQFKEVKSFTMDPNPYQLHQYLQRHFGDIPCLICYEAGCTGFTAYRTFKVLGYNCLVIHPADVPSTHKEKLQKSDPIDCRKLARELEKGSLSPIYIPSEAAEAFKHFIRYRGTLVKDLTRTKNRIKQFLIIQGKTIPIAYQSRYWSRKLFCWLTSIRFAHVVSNIQWQSLLRTYETQQSQLADLVKEINIFIASHPQLSELYWRVRSAPGIGFVSAITIIAEVDQMSRFPEGGKFTSYAGLIPTIQGSGSRQVQKGLTPRCNRRLRKVFIEAAWTAIRKDPGLHKRFYSYRQRMHSNKAITAIARHLALRVRSTWLKGENYQLEVA